MAGLALMAAGEAPNFLAGMLPSLMTIGRFASEDEDRAKLRRGELVGTGLALVVGAGAAMVVGSVIPFVLTVAVVAVLLYEYERAIKIAQEGDHARPINNQ